MKINEDKEETEIDDRKKAIIKLLIKSRIEDVLESETLKIQKATTIEEAWIEGDETEHKKTSRKANGH